jgi:hypothetical protein
MNIHTEITAPKVADRDELADEAARGLDTLLGDAITRADVLPAHTFAKTADGSRRLVIDFKPADLDNQPGIDMFKIILLKPRKNGAGYHRCGHWDVDINRGRDPAHNGEVEEVWDGSVRDGVDNLLMEEASEASCRKLIKALHGAVQVEMGEAANRWWEDIEEAA